MSKKGQITIFIILGVIIFIAIISFFTLKHIRYKFDYQPVFFGTFNPGDSYFENYPPFYTSTPPRKLIHLQAFFMI